MTLRWKALSVAVVLLAACGDKDAGKVAEAPKPSSQSLAAAIDGDLARVVENSGLKTALEGVGPYTLFAPPNAALKPAGADFTDPALKAESAALLQAHIIPGSVTRADLAAAVDKAGAQGAQMRSMAGDMLTFTREGETIVATSPDGAKVRLTDTESLLSNGVMQPVDGLLIKPGAPAAAG